MITNTIYIAVESVARSVRNGRAGTHRPWTSQPGHQAGRLAIRKALAGYTGKAANGPVSVGYKNGGAPYLIDYQNLSCSISHSCGWGAAAIASSRVGIDIEKIVPRDQSVLDYIASRHEQSLVATGGESSSELIAKLWVIKESVLKATGLGLVKQVKSARVVNTASFEEQFLVETDEAVWRVSVWRRDWYYVAVALGKEYVASIDWHQSYQLSTR